MKTDNAVIDVVEPADRPSHRIVPELVGVSETLLWGLHNRASEARLADGALTDPDCVRIHDAIDYDLRTISAILRVPSRSARPKSTE